MEGTLYRETPHPRRSCRSPGAAARGSYNQQINASYMQKAGLARYGAAKEVYGTDTTFWLGLQDTIHQCVPHCPPIYIGAPPSHP
jgi:hypothetical protein